MKGLAIGLLVSSSDNRGDPASHTASLSGVAIDAHHEGLAVLTRRAPIESPTLVGSLKEQASYLTLFL